jgi:protocatechuate 3,4-dioxygenase beta subunit
VRVSAALILCLIAAAPSQSVPPRPTAQVGQPPRDIARQEPAGTSAIKGRVVAADTGSPIRRANVTLVRGGPPQAPGGRGAAATGASVTPPSRSSQPLETFNRPRQAVTNAQGVFEFNGLQAGTYRVIVSGAAHFPQYLGMAYGAKRPNAPFSSDMGQSISVTEGQTFDKAVVRLPRGAVISGRVTDESSEPLARVQVYTVFYPPGSTRGQRTGFGAQTDDLGQFRLYGLAAGDYIVAAEARENTYSSPNAPLEVDEEKIGFLTTYYPGTTDEAGASRVRARAGSETPGIEIRLGEGRLFRVSGSVLDSQGKPAAQVIGQLMRREAGFNGGSTFGFSTDEKGQFQMRNLPPGNYRLVVQPMRQNFGPGGRGNDADPGEMAMVSLMVASDLDNVIVMTMPGATITGRLVIEQAPPSPSPGPLRVMAVAGGSEDSMAMRTSQQPVLVGPDQTFTIKGLMGEYLLRVAAPNLYVKSITLDGGDDVTDTPHEFKTNDRVVMTVTSRASTLEGTVTDSKGALAAETGVILFSEERGAWRTSSTRTRRTAADAEGHFRIPGLMPGKYFVIAVPRERMTVVPGSGDALFFEQLSKDAVSVVIGDDEERKLDLKVVEGP